MEAKPWICNYPWTHFNLNPDGACKPCCRSLIAKAERPILGANLLDVVNSDGFIKTRQQMLAGQVPAGCVKCALEEKANAMSLRQKSLIDPLMQISEPKTILNEKDIVFVEWFLGPECNLKCLTCGPELSTTWKQDAKHLNYPIPPTQNHSVEPLFEQLPNLRRLKLLGGEPFLTPQFQKILDRLDQAGTLEDTELVISTNATLWPSEKTLSQLLRFKKIQISMSVDGVGHLNEYVRFPSQWPVVESHIKKYFELYMNHDHVDICLVVTVSAYNIFGLPKIYEWWNELGKPESDQLYFAPVLNMVLHPQSMAPTILPKPLIQLAVDQLAAVDFRAAEKLYKMTAAAKFDPVLFEKFVREAKIMDQVRSQDIRKVAPELRDFFN